MRDHNLRLLTVLLLLGTLACSGYSTYREAQVSEQTGDWDQAVLQYLDLLDSDPGNIGYRAGLLRAKVRASQEHFRKGRDYYQAGVIERAMVEYQQAVQLDPTNEYAEVELQKVRQEIAAARADRAPAMSLEDLKAKTRGARPQPPVLNPRSREPISLDFPEPVSMFQIYQALGKAFGINILFDPGLRDQDMSIELKDVTAQSALETLMRASGQFYKVVDEHSIIVAADTPQNRRKYEDLVIQTFFLSNAEVKDVMTMLRSLVGARNIAQNDQLNAIVLRDTADKVKVAERIILTNDKSRGEVIVDVELLQINSNKLQELGVSLSSYQITQSVENSPVRASDLQFLNQSNWLVSIPSIIYNFVKNSSEAELLAKPQLRISDGEKARLLIGDRVPIPVTTFNTSQTIGGNIVPITSFQYQDVGIKIELEPRIHHNKEVTLKLTVEVSNLSGSVAGGAGGPSQPIIGTRTIESTIRLKDGETNFLAGLIRSDQTVGKTGVPGLSDIPLLGRLFSSNSTNQQRTDLVLTMTPHIIRTPDISEEDLLPIWVGTEANITFRGGSPRVESDQEGPFDEPENQSEEIRDMIRRRIQNLPRDLGGEAEQPQEQAPEDQNIIQGGAPEDFFNEPSEQPPPPQTPPEQPQEQQQEPPPDDLFDSLEQQEPPPLLGARAPGWSGDEGWGSLRAVPASLPLKASFHAPGEVAVSLLAPPRAPRVGETFDVVVNVTSAAPVAHLPLALTFDPDRLAVERVQAGDFLGPVGEAQVLSDLSHPGRIMLGASRLGRLGGVMGSGTLARVTFRALAAGRANLAFDGARALDSELHPVQPLSLTELDLLVIEGPPDRDPIERPRA